MGKIKLFANPIEKSHHNWIAFSGTTGQTVRSEGMYTHFCFHLVNTCYESAGNCVLKPKWIKHVRLRMDLFILFELNA